MTASGHMAVYRRRRRRTTASLETRARSVIDRTRAHLLACPREIGADAVAEKLEH
jgi:hypothetical protein